MKEPSIAIILVNWNGYEDTLQCLHSLQKVNYKNFTPLIVDNGSIDASVSILQKAFPEIKLIQTKENLGFAGGNNVGIKWAYEQGFDYIFLLNNDTIVDEDILTAFVSAAKNKPKAGILGAQILRFDDPKIIDHLGGFWDEKKADFSSFHTGESYLQSYEMKNVDYVCGCAFFIKKEVIQKIGYLDPRFFLIWEESDYCYKAKRNGFEIWTAPKAKLWHKISASFVGGKPHTNYYWWRNRLLWIENNLQPKQKMNLFFSTLLPQIVHLFKLKWLKALQLFGLKLFSPSSLTEKRITKFLRYKAGCKGIWDYLFRRFGKGPNWLTQKKDKKIFF